MYVYMCVCIYTPVSYRISLNMDNSKSDTVALELNTCTKQNICAFRAPGLILKNICTISS